MGKMNFLDYIAIILLIIGGINWGIVAINPAWDLVSLATFDISILARIIKGIVGLSGLYAIYSLIKLSLR